MSMPASELFTPILSPSRAASAACSSALVGMQPQCRQVPPSLSFSTSTTDMPSSAARSAQAYPPDPPPRMTRSALCSGTSHLPRIALISALVQPPPILSLLGHGSGSRAHREKTGHRARCVGCMSSEEWPMGLFARLRPGGRNGAGTLRRSVADDEAHLRAWAAAHE